MSLSTIARPLAQYRYGTPVLRSHQTTGLTEGRLYRTAGGEVCVVQRSAFMPAPSFWYYPNLLSAWAVFRAERDRAAALYAPRAPRPTLRDLLIAEGVSDARLRQLEQLAGAVR